ncbi:thyroid hormone receptor-associated protein 3-like isoform X2 [Myxocyprinus asiaticus]|uniref:thyroid hormone receptor-associated protein 3-like isoform X2 n=1 Tax=Myxocyprinus asiaticus TaxID=70543 RepID=UPI002223C777|nr:thyroid hormone receptor-associated protein 3-like isoform X2 [Myxocyprinus asiaticus]
MSKTKKSHSRSRSASRSRSHSDSRSRSRSKSSSRSRSRKRRYESRSHSRSRSHSPFHNRKRNHIREYQNQHEFRGNHRGFRRPYYFRGRGQGFFRGRFQRGGRGGYNNYRPKNWQNFRQHPHQQQHQQQQQQYHLKSPKRGRSRSRTPKKQSSSPQSRSHSRRSDRSSSGRSPLSHHSSSSNSGSAKHSCRDVREDVSAPKDTHDQGEGDGALAAQVGGSSLAEENADGGRTLENCQVLKNHDTSPKKTSPQVCSSVIVGQADSVTNETSPSHKSSNAPNNGATTWQNVATVPPTKSPIKKSPVFNGLGLFSNVDQQTDDTVAISAAFLKFLEEQKSKKQAPAWENNTHKDKSNGELVRDKESNGGIFDNGSGIGLSRTPDHGNTGEEKKYKFVKKCEGNMPSISGTQRGPQNGPPFLHEDGEEEDEEIEISDKMRDMENNPSKSKSKVTLSAREMFEERIRRLQDMAWDDELEALLLCHKQEKAANILSALSKRDQISVMFKDPSLEKLSKVKRKEKSTMNYSSKPAMLSNKISENHEQEMFVVMSEESPPRAAEKRGTEFSVRMDSLSDDLARSSVLTNERRNLLDFVHLNKKDWEFHSVLQHLQAQQSTRSPSELFAQHIVSIVHHIKAQYFPSSGMTLNDRFAVYQRRAAEKEFMKQRKSPEIHRRIDVSPSAFKRHSLLFDEMKSSLENSFKVDGKKSKGDSMDLRLDIERRKKYLSGESDHKEEEYKERVSRESPESCKEISTEKVSKHHKKMKKSKKKRERSQSSSSSTSSSSVYHEEEAVIKAKGSNKTRLGFREYGEPMERGQKRGGFLRMRGRSWNRVNFHGNSNGNDAQMNMSAKNEDWDTEYTPQSNKYFLHSERDGDGERKLETCGRGRGNILRAKGRFILRRATNANNTNNTSPKWTHDKFQATDDEGEQQGEDAEQDHKKRDSAGVSARMEQ